MKEEILGPPPGAEEDDAKRFAGKPVGGRRETFTTTPEGKLVPTQEEINRRKINEK